ncbi:MAG TPA: tyrosine-type recombinase/integrase [Pirellulales bacterium]
MIALNQLALIETAPHPQPLVAGDPNVAAAGRLIALFVRSGKSERTTATYLGALDDFAGFMQQPTAAFAVSQLLASGRGPCTAVIQRYLVNMNDRALAPHTHNLRLTVLRSLLEFANSLDMISWTVRVKGIRGAGNVKDCRGPTLEQVRAMYARIVGDDAPARRSRAAFRLLFDLGLRRMEVLAIDVEDCDLSPGGRACVMVRGKGKRTKSPITLPEETAAALRSWMAVRGAQPGPLFISLSNSSRGRRLSGQSLFVLIQDLGRQVGTKTGIHQMRHSSITAALTGTNGDVRRVRFHSRHADLATIAKYDDARQDMAGGVAKLVAGMLE